MPRTRGGMRSPVMAWEEIMRPPPPRPCRARQAMSWPMLDAVPHSAEPMRNRAMAMRKRFLRPTRSPSLP